jgi:hypothetical protein
MHTLAFSSGHQPPALQQHETDWWPFCCNKCGSLLYAKWKIIIVCIVGSLTSHNTILSKIKQIRLSSMQKGSPSCLCVVSTPIQGKQFASSCMGTWWVWENDRMPQKRGRSWVKKQTSWTWQVPASKCQLLTSKQEKNAIDQLEVKCLTKVSIMVQKALFNVLFT